MQRHNVKLAVVGGTAALLLGTGTTVALAAVSGGAGMPGPYLAGGRAGDTACSAPTLPGPVVDVSLTDMGAGMRGWQHGRWMHRGGMMGGTFGHPRMMRVRVGQDSVRSGTVSLRVSDLGVMRHELVVLPLGADSRPGDRQVREDGTIDETGSVGEVSNNCGAGEGDGLRPGGVGWTTLRLEPGRYELVCNLPGHYWAGMYAELDVTSK